MKRINMSIFLVLLFLLPSCAFFQHDYLQDLSQHNKEVVVLIQSCKQNGGTWTWNMKKEAWKLIGECEF